MALQSEPSSFILTSNLSASDASSQEVGMLREGAIAEAGARFRGVLSSLLLALDGLALAFGVVVVSSSPSPSASASSVTSFGVTFLGFAGVRFFLGVIGSRLSLLASSPSAASAAAFFALAETAFFLGVLGSATTVAFVSPFLAVSLSA